MLTNFNNHEKHSRLKDIRNWHITYGVSDIFVFKPSESSRWLNLLNVWHKNIGPIPIKKADLVIIVDFNLSYTTGSLPAELRTTGKRQ